MFYSADFYLCKKRNVMCFKRKKLSEREEAIAGLMNTARTARIIAHTLCGFTRFYAPDKMDESKQIEQLLYEASDRIYALLKDNKA